MSKEPFDEIEFDGIMGLSFRQLSVTDNFNIIENMINKTCMSQFYIDMKKMLFVVEEEEPAS